MSDIINDALKIHFNMEDDAADDKLINQVTGQPWSSNGNIAAGAGAGQLSFTGTHIITPDNEDFPILTGNKFLKVIYATTVAGDSSATYGNFVSTPVIRFGINFASFYSNFTDTSGSASFGTAHMGTATGMNAMMSNGSVARAFNGITLAGSEDDVSALDGDFTGVAEQISIGDITNVMGYALFEFGEDMPDLISLLAYTDWLGSKWAAGEKVTDPALWV